MADRPILFSAPMVRALIDGRKSQTRRIFKGIEHCPNGTWHIFNADGGVAGVDEADVSKEAPDYLRIQVGDRLWVRETWQGLTFGDYLPTNYEPCEIRYAATDPCADLDAEARGYPWRPSIFMPRFASRITLIVTGVRVERLQDISAEDAIAEGLIKMPFAPALAVEMGCNWGFEGDTRHGSPVSAYAALWDYINGDGAWEANPWVAAYTFRVIKTNIDHIGRGLA